MPHGWLKWLSLAVLLLAGLFVIVTTSRNPVPGVLIAMIFGGMGWLLGTERRRTRF